MRITNRPIRLCRIAAVPITFKTLLYQQVRDIAASGIDLTVVTSPGPEFHELATSTPGHWHALPIARKPAPQRDLRALITLTRFFHQQHFDVVHSSTPKAGLLTALAGALTRVPVRLHTFTGQAWVELRGPVRALAQASDRLIGQVSTQCYADSLSQRDFLVANGLVAERKIKVLGGGSISGVDLKRFDPAALAPERARIRGQLGISPTDLVITFVGRVTRDKGIGELVSAFTALHTRCNHIHLMLVGPHDVEGEVLDGNVLATISSHPHIHAVGFQAQPERYLAAADIFALPSYREGFGSVVIEAGAMGLPTVATRVTGLVDAVVDGQTGVLVPAKDVPALTEAFEMLLAAPQTRQCMGRAARQRAVQTFDAHVVNQAVIAEYFALARRS